VARPGHGEKGGGYRAQAVVCALGVCGLNILLDNNYLLPARTYDSMHHNQQQKSEPGAGESRREANGESKTRLAMLSPLLGVWWVLGVDGACL